jgi:L-lactate dehydrogenase (cytochrome)
VSLTAVCHIYRLIVEQIYLNKDRAASANLLQKVEELGAKAIIFTVDVSWASKRTLDVRSKTTKAKQSRKPGHESIPNKSTASSRSFADAIGGYQDRNLTWEDISFIRVSLDATTNSLSMFTNVRYLTATH